MIKIAIFGGSGYGGSELLRILLQHPLPRFSSSPPTSRRARQLATFIRNLLGLTQSEVHQGAGRSRNSKRTSIVHSLRCRMVSDGDRATFAGRREIIDLSGDFRLSDAEVFAKHYDREQTAMDAQAGFVYG
jgi:N-acetyl-gamma-glutamylphosphate reductase